MRPRDGSRSGVARFLGILAIYAVPGPLIGAFGVNALFTAYALGAELPDADAATLGRLFWGGLVLGTVIASLIAYAIGGVSALGVGLAVAIRDHRQGEISGRTALLAALAFWLFSTLFALLVVSSGARFTWVGALLVAHLFAMGICTWMAKRLFAPQQGGA